MALSMEGRSIPLHISATLCVNHPSLILHLPSSSLLSPLHSLSFSVSQAASNWTHKLLSPPPLTPTKSFPFSTLLSWNILFFHQICIPLIKLNYSWLPNIPCPDGCQHRNAWLWTCNDTAPHFNMSYSLFPAPSMGRLPRHSGLQELSATCSFPSTQHFNKCTMDDTRTSVNERTDILITPPFFIRLHLHLLIAVVNHSLTSPLYFLFANTIYLWHN